MNCINKSAFDNIIKNPKKKNHNHLFFISLISLLLMNSCVPKNSFRFYIYKNYFGGYSQIYLKDSFFMLTKTPNFRTGKIYPNGEAYITKFDSTPFNMKLIDLVHYSNSYSESKENLICVKFENVIFDYEFKVNNKVYNVKKDTSYTFPEIHDSVIKIILNHNLSNYYTTKNFQARITLNIPIDKSEVKTNHHLSINSLDLYLYYTFRKDDFINLKKEDSILVSYNLKRDTLKLIYKKNKRQVRFNHYNKGRRYYLKHYKPSINCIYCYYFYINYLDTSLNYKFKRHNYFK